MNSPFAMVKAVVMVALVAGARGSTSTSVAAAQPSKRSQGVRSFKVMDVVAAAAGLEAAGRKVFHLEVGQPVTGAPREVQVAASRAIREQVCGYTVSTGVEPLRRAIVRHYELKEGLAEGTLSPSRVVVTTGSSGGFLLVFHACFDVGDTVAVGMTCYPCYRNILSAMNVETVSIPLNAEYKLTATELRGEVERRRAAGLPPLKGLIQSTPANPTGAMLSASEVRDLCAVCEAEGIWYISDEIYHGISFGTTEEVSALRFDDALYSSRRRGLKSLRRRIGRKLRHHSPSDDEEHEEHGGGRLFEAGAEEHGGGSGGIGGASGPRGRGGGGGTQDTGYRDVDVCSRHPASH